MRRFQLVRNTDFSGISGTGVVAEGVVFSDGYVALHWLGSWPTTSLLDSLDWVVHIHGHNGATQIEFVDEEA